MSWLGFFGGFAMIFFAIGISSKAPGWAGALTLIFGIAVGMTRGRLIYASMIDDGYVCIKGAGREYLNTLPKV